MQLELSYKASAGQSRRAFSWLLFPLLVAPGVVLAADSADPGDVERSVSTAVPAWRIRLLDLGWDTRFNYMDRQGGTVTDRGLQYRLRVLARVDLFKGDQTYLTVRAETGKGFDNSWNNAGMGLGRGQTIFNVKSISLHQKLTKSLEAEAGGLDFERGAGTDATYASGDGHMTGYRVVFDGRADRQPEKISVTAAYLGDFDEPNFFSRSRMDRINYVQVLAEHRFSKELDASAEVDSIHSAVFLRGAIRRGKLWVFDDAGVEAAARATGRSRYAWSSTLSRHWTRDGGWRTDLVYSDLPHEFYVVDGQRVLWNRGEFDVGKRLAVGAVHRLTRDLEAGVFAGRLLDSTPSKRWVAQAGFSYQFAGLLNRALRQASRTAAIRQNGKGSGE